MNASPTIRQLQHAAEAGHIAFGPPAVAPATKEPSKSATETSAKPQAVATEAQVAPAPVEIIDTFGEYQAEYAAIRKGVGIFHMPQRGLIEVRGKERGEFLHRMTTNDTRGLKAGEGCRAFFLNTKGRITADMLVIAQDDRMLIDLDVFQAGPVVATLDRMLFSEDVQLRDASASFVCVSLHGPAGFRLLEALGARFGETQVGANATSLAVMRNATIQMCGADVVVYRRDDTGSPGLHLWIPVEAADRVYAQLAEAVGGLVPAVEYGEGTGAREILSAVPSLQGRGGQGTPSLVERTGQGMAGEVSAASQILAGGVDPKRAIPGRGIGWLAFNTARIEAGVPLYHVDFGPDSLPGETGVLHDAVSFKKGCYVGQEVVARMAHLGHPKRMVVGFRCEDDRMPIAGSQVFDASKEGEIIGAISSSTLSPLLGNVAIGLASMKWGKHAEGTPILVPAEGALVKATVCALPIVKAPGSGD